MLCLFLSNSAFAQEYGISLHFGQATDWTDDTANIAKTSGAEWVRSDIPATTASTGTKYKYDYSFFIENLERAKSRNLKVSLILWHPIPFDSLNQYEEYVNDTVTQFKGKVDAYEIWSEPISQKYGWYQGEPEKYFEMLKIAYQKIKSIDNHPIIIGLGTAANYNYDERQFCQKIGELGGKNYMDAFSLHTYDIPQWAIDRLDNITWTDRVIEDVKTRIIFHKSLLSPLPLWVTETGLSDWVNESWNKEWNQSWNQSRVMNRIFKMLNGIGTEKIFWYEFIDDITQQETDQGHYGLVYSNIVPKDSFYTFKKFSCVNGAINGICDKNCNIDSNCENRRIGEFFCSGNMRKQCDETCNSINLEICKTDALDSDGGINHFKTGTCTDYSGCLNGECQSTSNIDFCECVPKCKLGKSGCNISTLIYCNSFKTDINACNMQPKCVWGLEEYYTDESSCPIVWKNCQEYGSEYYCTTGRCVKPASGGCVGKGCYILAIGPYVFNVDITPIISVISAILVIIEIVVLMTIYNRLKHTKRKR